MTKAELLRAAEDLEFCCAHIAASDYNLGDDSLAWIMREGRVREVEGDPRNVPACDACREFCEALLALPERERYASLDALGYWEGGS